jgi:3-isopropylmalate dehydrogenase
VIGGDGTGPEVVREALKVLDVAAKKFDLKLSYTNYDIGGDRYIRTGEVLPDSILTRAALSTCGAQKQFPISSPHRKRR